MALIVTPPVEVPELVMVPTWLTLVVESVIPAAVELLLFSIKFPLPLTPPETVRSVVPLVLVNVVPELLTLKAVVLMVNADVVLLRVIAVTLTPMPPLMVVVPDPAPILVTVPTILTLAVEKTIVPVVALLLIVRLLVPVIPPLNVPEIPAPVLPIVSVPLVLAANTIGLAYVKPLVPNCKVALLAPPALSPKVMILALAPNALALVVPNTVPFLIVKPVVNVLTPLKVSVEPVLF